MVYPQEFVSRVKCVFSDWGQMHVALDAGSLIVGYYLRDHSKLNLTPSQMLELIDRDQVDKLRLRLQECIVAGELYKQWEIMRTEQENRLSAEKLKTVG